MLQALGRARAPNKTQIALGAIILLAYGCSLFAAQVQPEEGSATQRVLKTMEYSFAAIFTVELLANLFSHSDKWFRTFFADGLNVCDLLVVVCMNWAVLLEYFSPAAQKLPALQVLRLLRVFKVVRLFRRLQSLRILINALVASLVPLMHALGLLVLSTSVYAVIAVDLFQESEPEFFGSLAHSMLTFFQVRN
jgi:voltage-gated sodium channel